MVNDEDQDDEDEDGDRDDDDDDDGLEPNPGRTWVSSLEQRPQQLELESIIAASAFPRTDYVEVLGRVGCGGRAGGRAVGRAVGRAGTAAAGRGC